MMENVVQAAFILLYHESMLCDRTVNLASFEEGLYQLRRAIPLTRTQVADLLTTTHDLQAGFVLLYEGVGAYRATDDCFTAEEMAAIAKTYTQIQADYHESIPQTLQRLETWMQTGQ